MEKLSDVSMRHGSYESMPIPDGAVIYCDPPYASTTAYDAAKNFDTGEFWDWVRYQSSRHAVYVSEFNAPKDFVCIWEKQTKSSLNAKSREHKPVTEKLFVHENQFFDLQSA